MNPSVKRSHFDSCRTQDLKKNHLFKIIKKIKAISNFDYVDSKYICHLKWTILRWFPLKVPSARETLLLAVLYLLEHLVVLEVPKRVNCMSVHQCILKEKKLPYHRWNYSQLTGEPGSPTPGGPGGPGRPWKPTWPCTFKYPNLIRETTEKQILITHNIIHNFIYLWSWKSNTYFALKSRWAR